MQGESNSLNPYELFSQDQDKYWFQTTGKVAYIAYFTSSPGYFNQYPHFNHDILTFTFEPYGECRRVLYSGIRASRVLSQSHDKRIMETIVWILLQSLKKSPQKSIVMICEAEDRLDACRNRLFTRWFQKANEMAGNVASKYDTNFAGEGYGSIFIHNENPYHSTIREAFLNIPYSNPDK
jgi:hypothetical protein